MTTHTWLFNVHALHINGEKPLGYHQYLCKYRIFHSNICWILRITWHNMKINAHRIWRCDITWHCVIGLADHLHLQGGNQAGSVSTSEIQLGSIKADKHTRSLWVIIAQTEAISPTVSMTVPCRAIQAYPFPANYFPSSAFPKFPFGNSRFYHLHGHKDQGYQAFCIGHLIILPVNYFANSIKSVILCPWQEQLPFSYQI